jgi:predicted metal-dependent hydrolase
MHFELVRSDRRTLGIAVRPDGSVVVRAPRRARESEIAHRVIDHGAWLERTRRKLAAHRALMPPPLYAEGELHLLLGRRYPLTIAHGEPEAVRLTGGRLQVTLDGARDGAQPERARRLLEGWYERQARQCLTARLEACWASFCSNGDAALGHDLPKLRLKRMRTRWGSMSPKGAMSLNLDLVRAPVPCIDYVIVHELCHLVHAHHGREFWALVERLMPDWRRRRRLLRETLP